MEKDNFRRKMANDTDSVAGIEQDTSKLPGFLGCINSSTTHKTVE